MRSFRLTRRKDEEKGDASGSEAPTGEGEPDATAGDWPELSPGAPEAPVGPPGSVPPPSPRQSQAPEGGEPESRRERRRRAKADA